MVKRLIGCLKLQVIFRTRATNYRSLLRKMTCNLRHPMTLRHPVHAHLFVICVCGDTSMCVCVYAQYVCLSPWRIDVYGNTFGCTNVCVSDYSYRSCVLEQIISPTSYTTRSDSCKAFLILPLVIIPTKLLQPTPISMYKKAKRPILLLMVVS